jgi:hypothetical protein
VAKKRNNPVADVVPPKRSSQYYNLQWEIQGGQPKKAKIEIEILLQEN